MSFLSKNIILSGYFDNRVEDFCITQRKTIIELVYYIQDLDTNYQSKTGGAFNNEHRKRYIICIRKPA